MTKYKIEDEVFTLVPENEDTKEMLAMGLKVLKEGIDYISIKGSLNIGEIELKNITLIIFGSGKIILRNEEIEISGYYKVNRRESKEN
ncbi:TPA: hypothetical protein KN238_000096 [Clostridioides difficile]|nr:hypothetical protein [Clostridioides difficile]HBF3756666.1 hypothetical protein [Clostridioides difficile]HBF6247003.1 hypothetical protein [Clostridioides difficile]HBY3218756.1 hypothetical protein [Clostridioides difficile]